MDTCVTCARLADQVVPADHEHCEMCAASLAQKDGQVLAECIWCGFINVLSS
jgi:hypothetical protein